MTAKSRRKKPKIEKHPPGRGARAEHSPQDNIKKRPCWAVSNIDREGAWGWGNIASDELWNDVIPKLQSFETMTWREVMDGGNSHNIECERIVSEAKKRLEELNLDDLDHLFSLRLTGRKRIWGILEGVVLKIL